MKIGIFTYQAEHRKTWDTLGLLNLKGYRDVTVFAIPYKYKKTFTPLYEHRPVLPDQKLTGMNHETEECCKSIGYEYMRIEDYDGIGNFGIDVFLYCGGGLLPDCVWKNYRVINSHPGYIPLVRGLDALKWAIVMKAPIGVTTHFIGEYVDAGEVIQRVEVPLYQNDTFHSIAQRQYEYEVCLLVEALRHLDEIHPIMEPGESIVHKRMPASIEGNLLEAFEAYKLTYL